jgi:hypothetical protein
LRNHITKICAAPHHLAIVQRLFEIKAKFTTIVGYTAPSSLGQCQPVDGDWNALRGILRRIKRMANELH